MTEDGITTIPNKNSCPSHLDKHGKDSCNAKPEGEVHPEAVKDLSKFP